MHRALSNAFCIVCGRRNTGHAYRRLNVVFQRVSSGFVADGRTE